MATNPPITPASAKKPRAKRSDAGKHKFEYYAVNGSVPCRIDRSGLLHKRPLLVPCLPGEALEILGRGAARGPKGRMDTMVARTIDTLKRVGGNTIFEKTDKMKAALARYAGISGDWRLEKRRIAAESAGTTG